MNEAAYYIPVQVNIVFRVPGCPVHELRAVMQLVLLSLFPTGTLMILPIVIRASWSVEREDHFKLVSQFVSQFVQKPVSSPSNRFELDHFGTLFYSGEVDDPALVPQQLLFVVLQPLHRDRFFDWCSSAGVECFGAFV